MRTGKYLSRFQAVLVAVGAVLLGAGVFILVPGGTAPPPVPASLTGLTIPPTVLGIWNGSPGSVPAGAHPDVLNDYLYYGAPFPAQFAAQAQARGAVPFVELEPWQGNGTSDCGSLHGSTSYYQGIGSAIAAFGHPVILTWAHEFNIGGQYPWSTGNGCGFTAADWIAGWKSVVTAVRSAAGGDALFMWVPNVDPNGNATGAAKYWPGAQYADMTGVDGYPSLCQCGGSFSAVYGGTFAEIKALPGFSSLPQQKIFLAETDVAPLGSGGFDSVDKFTSDMCQAGGDGLLQFQDGTQALSTAQWTALEQALAAHCGGTAPVPVSAVTHPAAGSVTTPAAPGATVTPSSPPPGKKKVLHFTCTVS